jgi:ribonuclease VapC
VIVDTSVVIAIIFGESDADVLARAISMAPSCRLSAGSFLEASILAESRSGDKGIRLLDSFLQESRAIIEAVTEEQGLLARQGYSDFGTGRHAAGLNFGDCFAYALAKATGEPLLFKGEDFRKTDIIPALP